MRNAILVFVFSIHCFFSKLSVNETLRFFPRRRCATCLHPIGRTPIKKPLTAIVYLSNIAQPRRPLLGTQAPFLFVLKELNFTTCQHWRTVRQSRAVPVPSLSSANRTLPRVSPLGGNRYKSTLAPSIRAPLTPIITWGGDLFPRPLLSAHSCELYFTPLSVRLHLISFPLLRFAPCRHSFRSRASLLIMHKFSNRGCSTDFPLANVLLSEERRGEFEGLESSSLSQRASARRPERTFQQSAPLFSADKRLCLSSRT